MCVSACRYYNIDSHSTIAFGKNQKQLFRAGFWSCLVWDWGLAIFCFWKLLFGRLL